MTTPLPVPGTTIGQGLPGLTGIGGTSTLNSLGINVNGLSASTFSSSKAIPTDNVFVGLRALGRTAPTVGHDLQRQSGSIDYGTAQNLPGSWYANDQNFYKQFITKAIMYKLPGASPDMGLPEAGQVWDSLLQQSIQLTKATGQNWTPWQVMESYNHKPGSLGTTKQGDWLIDNATGERVKYVGPRTKTSKQTSIDLSDSEAVQAIATQALTQLIGRAPTDQELAKFKATLNGYERSHPETQITTDTYDDQGNVTASNVTHSGGVDDAARAAVLGEGVKKTPEYGKYQSGTTYFNALLQMIGGG